MRTLLCVFLALSLSACDKATEGFSQGFDSAFKTNFRTSFIDSCVKSAGSRGNKSQEKLTKLCTCAADGVMKDATVSDLQDVDKIRSKSGPIIEQCVKEAVGLVVDTPARVS
ncbi:hypothetical protein SAMN05518854_10230 [Variovorax sp. YR266]|uniref:hypothetical protein n=1 Tax=Variovorax sp. YR266 TaxID=1884386 RepID=UPI00089AD769|nr:hypothetical protein [Variovorax sp. YR266]SDY59490.1 hypothetical protein SAMN05518854_10230 [Variovorax sp. YR266]